MPNVSRKFTQLGEVSETTAIKYLKELAEKYPEGATIAEVPSNLTGRNRGIFEVNRGNKLQGKMILEVPVQTKPIPQKVLDFANKNYIKIRDVKGEMYN